MNADTFHRQWLYATKPYRDKKCWACGEVSDDLKVVDYEGSMGAEFGVFCPKCRGKG